MCKGGRTGLVGISFLLSVLAVLFAGCVKNEFEVTFSLPADVNSTYKVLYYASDPRKGWVVENVVPVQKGKGETRLVTRNPCLVYVFASGAEPVTCFYARRGDRIEISGDSSDPLAWTISGNKINDRLTAWRISSCSLVAAARGGSAADVSALNKAVSRYVADNPDDPVAALLLQLYYDRGVDEAGFRKWWGMLEGDALDGEWRELVSRSDLLEDVPAVPPMPKRIVLNTVQTGCDTVVPGRVPVLLYFSRTSCASYRSDIDSIRGLSREYRDSTRRVIANIQLEPDSSVRWQSVRADSLQGVVQAWVPLGLSDATVRELGVRRFPWFIVIGRDSRTAYCGSGLREAFATFRHQLGKPL